uniref:MgtC/SapB/SrpB/YhiD N-terminal domain-containing protein n=1 Tax=Minutocellus polymorphus TaxID=265543 RepID=A0A7S0AUM1_9STRA|mmetsp:Transcript_37/g.61  ORF Transcript_37/g.61 Transcript_37/m.61 type:complete len:252 (+) Transcript_37:332-1087(+)
MSTTPPFPFLNEWDIIGRIFGAAGLASLIGFEREAKNKPANVRMHILVGAGAATFVGVALLNSTAWQSGDINRVPAGVASGVGFLGAGTIFKIDDKVKGLTTAAGIWMVAAIGYSIGAGYWFLGIFATLLVLVVQFGFLFFLSPHFWADLKEKYRVTYKMESADVETEGADLVTGNEGQEEDDPLMGAEGDVDENDDVNVVDAEQGDSLSRVGSRLQQRSAAGSAKKNSGSFPGSTASVESSGRPVVFDRN